MPDGLAEKVWQYLPKIARFRINPHRIVQKSKVINHSKY